MAVDKTETLSIRVTSELKQLLKLAAAREQRTQTNLLERLLVEHCRKTGLLRNKRSKVQHHTPKSNEST